MEEKEYYSSSKIGTIIKDLAILVIILGIVIGFIVAVSTNIAIGITIVLGMSAFSLLSYALGEIIILLHDIRENTEHLRDRVEEKIEVWKKVEKSM